MGKKQHQKDKLYLTFTEWSTLYGGRRAQEAAAGASREFKRLPFDHCALSLQPFENPYADQHGNLFDLMTLLPFLKKYKVNPITGEKLEAKQLVKINFTKNSDGKYHCPVLYKVFNENSHIVANRVTGNVFSYEAIEELNIKPKNWKDLLTDQPFTRNDLITIQDPKNLRKFNFTEFHHVKNKLKIEDEELLRAPHDPNARLKNKSAETRDALDELNRTYVAKANEAREDKKADVVNAAHYSTGAVAASFTSTVMPVETVHEAAIRDEDSVRYERVKKKGYVRLNTTHGSINLELYCDVTPKTCENFLLLCKRGYYDGTQFHRSIKHFMIQGGDPTGKGTGGESVWGQPFEDEIRPNLHHEGRGVLSMANSGPNTNNSQFFITYRSCKHLDGKHTIFGKVVGGLDSLSNIERVETDNKDRPIEDIVIQNTTVFIDPFAEVDEQLATERFQDSEEDKAAKLEEQRKAKEKEKALELKVYRQGVGKYINPKRKSEEDVLAPPVSKTAKKKASGVEFKNFGNW